MAGSSIPSMKRSYTNCNNMRRSADPKRNYPIESNETSQLLPARKSGLAHAFGRLYSNRGDRLSASRRRRSSSRLGDDSTTPSNNSSIDAQLGSPVPRDDPFEDDELIDLDDVVMTSPMEGDATGGDSKSEIAAPARDAPSRALNPIDTNKNYNEIMTGSFTRSSVSSEKAGSQSNNPTSVASAGSPPKVACLPTGPTPGSPGGNGAPSTSSLGYSSPSPSSPEPYRIPYSLRKRQRRRGSPKRSLWGRDGGFDRSPSPPAESFYMEKEWSDIRELSLKQQMQAYWELLYPNRNRTRVASENEQNYHDDVALTVKSCMKTAGNSGVEVKTVQWGINSAAEFTLDTSATDLSHLSPTTVERQFPSSFERYEEMHPVDEEMLRITKENSAILAAADEYSDDSSSESSDTSGDDIHCFKDSDDDDEYLVPVRRSSRARKDRRASRIFTREPLLEPPPDSAALSSALGLSPIKGLSPSSHLSSNTRSVEPQQSMNAAGDVPRVVIVQPSETSLGTVSPIRPLLALQLNATSPAEGPSLDLEATEEAVSLQASPAGAWTQKFLQFCLSPLSQVEDISLALSLECVLSKLSEVSGIGCQDVDGYRTSSFSDDVFSWLESFDSTEVFLAIIDDSFLTARTAVSLLPQVSEESLHDPELESWAISEWLKLETQALEAIDCHLSCEMMQNLPALCEHLARITKEVGTLEWIQERCLGEEQAAHHLELDLLRMEWEYENRRKASLEHELSAFVANRYSTFLSHIVSPFSFQEWDDVEMQLLFRTPIQGLDLLAFQNSENGSLSIGECDEAFARTSNEDRDRLEPKHQCATFYRAMLRACTRILPHPDPQDITRRLRLFAVLVVRLEKACWDLHRLTLSQSTLVVDAGEAVAIVATVAPDVSFRTVYNLSDVRTLTLCLPTSSSLHASTTGKPILHSYPKQPLMQVLKSFLDSWMTEMTVSDCAEGERLALPT